MRAWLARAGFMALMTVAAALLAAETPKKEEKKNDKPEPLCPVMGKPIDKAVAVDYRGGKVYFCCATCVRKFKADQAKYATKANYQLVLTGQVQQTACPISGKKVDPKETLKVGGVEVAFCCGNCVKKVSSAKPAEQMELVFGKTFEKSYAVKKEKDKKESDKKT